ncbi:uncharacterized protein AMSG_00380 [Thecamonas trahens ATCC 50062]|uniref:DUF1279 domain-containing protein n=1 Tax=Thecamonas trahens ATCC 50062 TaxID=461836 RepID=A0A0L0DBE2_THETB|nr:hypothetical protein AMSG_00380 [Thecamonas trahens ATCC 50062]KNC48603.1 hypothetical protein AMSG_00380 [Thecamonas trahens ATCC 50062]|eukprot:XP_013762659.1 hypothetical protein AMSG_00380 [Thecamonas trahens ATCC 50062]
MLNRTLRRHPTGAFLSYPVAALSTWGVLYGALAVAGVSASPAMALAYVAGRLTARLSFPLGVAAAVPLAKLAPILTRIKVSALLVTPRNSFLGTAPREDASVESAAAVQKVERWMRKLEGPIDTYGAALLIGRRVVGLSKVAAFYGAISYGVDVEGMLASWGLAAEVGETAGLLAVATAANTLAFPVHVAGAVAAAPHMSALLRRIQAAGSIRAFVSRPEARTQARTAS